jgi:hypothetical protein
MGQCESIATQIRSNISIAFGGEQVLQQAHHPGHVLAAGQVRDVKKFRKNSHSEEVRYHLHLKILVMTHEEELKLQKGTISINWRFSMMHCIFLVIALVGLIMESTTELFLVHLAVCNKFGSFDSVVSKY